MTQFEINRRASNERKWSNRRARWSAYKASTHPRYLRADDTRSSQQVYNDWRKANPNANPEDHYLFARDRD